LAKALVASVRDLNPTVIADLAAGEGDLLFEAEGIWPLAKFVGTDIDPVAVRRLRRLRPDWNVGRANLRSGRSRARCTALECAAGSVSLLLLNPPFSCRGAARFQVDVPEGELSASAAMSFVLTAAKYLAANGAIVAILPLGCLHNDKDAQAWAYIRKRYRVAVVATYGKNAFPHSTASTVIVRLSPLRDGAQIVVKRASRRRKKLKLRVQLVRGCCPLHRSRKERNRPVLVHYTDLRNATVHLNGRRGYGPHRCIQGPAVLIPRVGNMTVDKVALFDSPTRIMISDCVIALKTSSQRHACAVRQRLVSRFSSLRKQYVGTGAPFITMARLTKALQSVGIDVDAV
jgi:predicted RNA methylase